MCVCTVGVCVCVAVVTRLLNKHISSRWCPASVNGGGGLNAAAAALGRSGFVSRTLTFLITSLRFPRRLRPPRLLPRRSPSVPPSPNEQMRNVGRRERRERGRTASHINIARQPSNQPKKGGVMKMCVFVCESARRCAGKTNRFACLIERHFSRL